MTEKKYFKSIDARTLIDVYGFALFPIYGVIDGHCTCGAYPCGENNRSAGKHPATPDGFKSATKDINELIKLWDNRNFLNVGIATGAVSNCFVIDVDGPQGDKELDDFGGIPHTLTSNTGRGRHLFFKYPGKNIKSRSGIIGGKVDVRGDGGYVVGPGSWHQNGHQYEWFNPLIDIEEAPARLLELVCRDRISTSREITSPPVAPARPRLASSGGWSEADVIEMLDYVDKNMGYSKWIDMGMALQSEGFGFHLWEDWSNKTRTMGADGHLRADPAMHWNSFKPKAGISFGTFVKMAQDGGWSRKKQNGTIIPHQPSPEAARINQGHQYNTVKDQIDNAAPVDKGNRPLIEFTMANDIQPTLEANDFVKGLLAEEQLSVVYGESNCGKTFFATDLGFHIGMGREWRGRRVDKGGVLYAALEGSYGLRNRVQAFRLKNGLDDALFAMVASQVDFMDREGNIKEFIECVKRAKDQMGGIKMVVVDTLARAMAGGNENEGQDMGMLVHHADRIRYEAQCHVCFIHHSGKDKARGARGHSSLRAAVDTEIEISRIEGADYSTIKIAKQREMEADPDMFFKLERVIIGVTALGEEKSSCVVRPVEKDDLTKPQQDQTLTPMQQFVYDAIVNAIAKCGTKRIPRQDNNYEYACIDYEQLRSELDMRGFKSMVDHDKARDVTNNIRVSLRRMGKIDFNKNYIWLTTKE